MNPTSVPDAAVAVLAVMAILMCLDQGSNFLFKARGITDMSYKMAYYAFAAAFATALCVSIWIAAVSLI